MRRKASLSHSPLAHPSTPIHALASQFQDFLHFPDPTPLYVVMGTVAANMMVGQSVWLMLIGESGCGKTEIVMTLSALEKIKIESKITGEAALLSGSSQKEFKQGAKGGLLKEVGSSGGMLIFKDFTSILSMQKDVMAEILGALREIFEGEWHRRIGGEGGRKMSWQGKVGVIAAVTPAIDRSHAMITEMGERFIFYRFPESDGWSETRQALRKSRQPHLRVDIKQTVKDFFDVLDFDWTTKQVPRELKESEIDGIIAMGQLAGRARGLVLRDPWSKEINEVPTHERPTRITEELGQLYLGMEAIGIEGGVKNEGWKIIQKMALDCMPMVRSIAIKAAMAGKGGKTSAAEIADIGRFSDGTAKRALEDLNALRVMERGKSGSWELTDRALSIVRRGWK